MREIARAAGVLAVVVAITLSVMVAGGHRDGLPDGCKVYEDGSAVCPADTFESGTAQGHWQEVVPTRR